MQPQAPTPYGRKTSDELGVIERNILTAYLPFARFIFRTEYWKLI